MAMANLTGQVEKLLEQRKKGKERQQPQQPPERELQVQRQSHRQEELEEQPKGSEMEDTIMSSAERHQPAWTEVVRRQPKAKKNTELPKAATQAPKIAKAKIPAILIKAKVEEFPALAKNSGKQQTSPRAKK